MCRAHIVSIAWTRENEDDYDKKARPNKNLEFFEKQLKSCRSPLSDITRSTTVFHLIGISSSTSYVSIYPGSIEISVRLADDRVVFFYSHGVDLDFWFRSIEIHSIEKANKSIQNPLFFLQIWGRKLLSQIQITAMHNSFEHNLQSVSTLNQK